MEWGEGMYDVGSILRVRGECRGGAGASLAERASRGEFRGVTGEGFSYRGECRGMWKRLRASRWEGVFRRVSRSLRCWECREMRRARVWLAGMVGDSGITKASLLVFRFYYISSATRILRPTRAFH